MSIILVNILGAVFILGLIAAPPIIVMLVCYRGTPDHPQRKGCIMDGGSWKYKDWVLTQEWKCPGCGEQIGVFIHPTIAQILKGGDCPQSFGLYLSCQSCGMEGEGRANHGI